MNITLTIEIPPQIEERLRNRKLNDEQIRHFFNTWLNTEILHISEATTLWQFDWWLEGSGGEYIDEILADEEEDKTTTIKT